MLVGRQDVEYRQLVLIVLPILKGIQKLDARDSRTTLKNSVQKLDCECRMIRTAEQYLECEIDRRIYPD